MTAHKYSVVFYFVGEWLVSFWACGTVDYVAACVASVVVVLTYLAIRDHL